MSIFRQPVFETPTPMASVTQIAYGSPPVFIVYLWGAGSRSILSSRSSSLISNPLERSSELGGRNSTGAEELISEGGEATGSPSG